MSFTLHLVFSGAGLAAARPLVRATDRLVCMHDLGDVDAPAGVTVRIAAEPGVQGAGSRAGSEIDYPTLARWCADAARVVSWP